MLTKWDDYPIHQLPTTFDHVGTTDSRFYDRYWFAMGRTDGEVLLEAGLGVYPNLNVIDGFALVTWRGRQHNVRLSRSIDTDRDTVIGPYAVEVLRGLRTLRLSLGDNDHDVHFDVTFDGAAPAYEEAPYFARMNGRVVNDFQHFNQAGRWSGSLTVCGTTYEVEPHTWWGERDRSWGVRPGVGPPQPMPATDRPVELPFGLSHWIPAQLPDRSLFYTFAETRDGRKIRFDGGFRPAYGTAAEGDTVKIVDAEHDMRLRPGGRQLESADLLLIDEHGEKTPVSVRSLTWCHLQEGGYGHPTSFHGAYRGPGVHVEGESYDLHDPQLVQGWRMPHAPDHFSEFRVGDAVGYGIFEYGLLSHERYTG